jgi:4-hydroxybenzoyl-CoA reductase subunit beta
MMRLPPFRYHAPETAAGIAAILRGEGPSAAVVAGGTDIYPNMKRRNQVPKTLVSLRNATSLRGIEWRRDGGLRIGPGESLRSLERDASVRARLPALHEAIESISTPVLRNMGTIGGNLCLDTRCNYYDQNEEWRRAIRNCLKCGGDTCWTAPGGDACWAVNSSDSVPVLMALGASVRLLSADGEREITARDLYAVTDGREWLTRKPDEVMTDIYIPPQGTARSVYRKLRRRAAFDFPVLGVAARVDLDGKAVRRADIVLNAVGPAPLRCHDAEKALLGRPLDDESIARAADLAGAAAKPLDNTDTMPSYRKRMIPVFVRRALAALK